MHKIFGNVNLEKIAHDPNFKEDSVREVLIMPLLIALGYKPPQIIRSKKLTHPFLKIGSKRRAVTLIPDYILQVKKHVAWVLDAKSPNEKIINDENVEQVYSYATHPEIRSNFFALCNGVEFSLYRTAETAKPCC